MTVPDDDRITDDDTTLIGAHLRVDSGQREHGVLFVLGGPRAGTIYPLDEPIVNLGRGPACQIPLQDEGVSRLHARILHTPVGFVLEDAGSRNGTFCQGARLTKPHVLREGDRIMVGATTAFRFSLQDQIESQAIRQTLELMNQDPLTELLNRRQLDQQLESEFAFAKRHDTHLAVLIADVDWFKRVNDDHGHPAGDEVLRQVSLVLAGAVRTEDVIGRYGGEEFAVTARGIDRDGVVTLGERLREVVQTLRVQTEGKNISVTISVGAVMMRPGHAQVSELIAEADEALYEAKRTGRNRVIVR